MLLLLVACFSSYNPEFDVEKISDGEIAEPEETYTEPDLDGDGYGLLAGDCDDSDPNISPEAEEICDFIDNNCNGLIDEGAEKIWFIDEDADGFGTFENPIYRCEALPGYTDNDLDCDDTDPTIYPEAEEICDEIDNNCNELIDEGLTYPQYADADEDGFGNPEIIAEFCAPKEGYSENKLDCDDAASTTYPNAPEICDEIDNDCNEVIDNDPTDAPPWFLDIDGDGFAGTQTLPSCIQPPDTSSTNLDCNDTDPNISPSASEICDEIDNNCDAVIDTDAIDASTWYADGDIDSFGSATDILLSCTQPTGYVSNPDDCDDQAQQINPIATEICDGIDNNCDSLSDDDDPNIDLSSQSIFFLDADGDSFGGTNFTRFCTPPSNSYVSDSSDCDDSASNRFPGATEICDEVDNDCDNIIDNNAVDASLWFHDVDRDGFAGNDTLSSCTQPANYFALPNDCNDSDSTINPDAEELCDAADRDCNGDPTQGAIDPDTFFIDDDNDGFGNPTQTIDACTQPNGYTTDNTDCDDTRSSVNPNGTETCNNTDDNCDTLIDNNAVDSLSWYFDSDRDGFGNNNNSELSCTPSSGFIADNTDCDDTQSAINPAATEICDGIDNNCNSSDDVPEDIWFADGDGDGFGDPDNTTSSCTQPNGYAADNTDCDDTQLAINPAATEICDELDNNCNPGDDIPKDIWFADGDGDGFGDPNNTTLSCTQPNGFVVNSNDCDDSSSTIRPGGTEVCNGLDDDCNNTADENAVDAPPWYLDGDNDGFGNPNIEIFACTAPSNHRANSADCDDNSALINPNATEVCDGLDNNCNNLADDDDSTLDPTTQSDFFVDNDSDGFGDAAQPLRSCIRPNNASLFSGDCDDNTQSTNPDADEVCDGVDNDCNNTTDDNAIDATLWFLDNDSDGFAGDNTLISCTQPGNGFANETDCDDNNINTNPSANEQCDGNDNNCNGTIDDNPIDGSTFFLDSDSDGFGDSNNPIEACSTPTGYIDNESDCNDTTSTVSPIAPEICDGIDNSCNNLIDNADPNILVSELSDFYPDNDNDGFGDNVSPLSVCFAPSGYTDNNADCNDNNILINPQADERCNGDDDNCNGSIDDDAIDAPTWFGDTDEDGFGGNLSTLQQCTQPNGFFEFQEDCDDSNPNKNPNADEICNGEDDDCNGAIDDNPISLATWYFDGDSDGYGDINEPIEECNAPQGYVSSSSDCDDKDADINPDANELCDGVDNNCDGLTDDDDPGVTDPLIWYLDGDSDGYGDTLQFIAQCTQPIGYTDNDLDCDDLDFFISPDEEEICDSLDNNCDGTIDVNATDAPFWFLDNDNDGFSGSDVIAACTQPSGTDVVSDDCNDNDINVFPGAPEICNGDDDDCNGSIDDNATDQLSFYRDVDGDGYGNLLFKTESCTLPNGFSENSEDCNDGNSQVNPQASEICDSQDNNCDGLVDDDDPSVDPATQSIFGFDTDGDGYGSSADTVSACSAPSGYVNNITDCQDTLANINPGETEECDGIDQDCDGILDSAASCPCEFFTFEDSSYYFCENTNLQWRWAEFACSFTGYTLISINSEDENLFAYSTSLSLSGGRWWIGLNDRDQEGAWEWSNGESLDYEAWGSGEPNNSGNEDCVELNRFGDETWNDVACNQSLRFICEASP